MWSFLLFILIGAVAGFIAGKIMRGTGFGFLLNIVIGIVGGIVGGMILGLFGFHSSNIIGSLITSVIGAVLLLWIFSLFNTRRVR